VKKLEKESIHKTVELLGHLSSETFLTDISYQLEI